MSDENQIINTKGNRQRNNIPRTTQVKRLHSAVKSSKSLKVWAREEKNPLTDAWLETK